MQLSDRPAATRARTEEPIASADSLDLLAAFRAGDARAREDLVRRHLKLVRQIASAHAPRDRALVQDLSQVGAIGLLRAIERFDPGLGRPFEAFAGACIAGEIRHFLRDHGQLVRLPRELQELRPRIVRTASLLAHRLDRPPSAEEIALELQMPLDKVLEVLSLDENSSPLSLDYESEAEPGKSLKDQLTDHRYRSFQLATEDRIMLGQAMARLKDVSREVIEFAFFEDLTQTEIARKLGISQMQVSRRVRSALGELWKLLNTRLWD